VVASVPQAPRVMLVSLVPLVHLASQARKENLPLAHPRLVHLVLLVCQAHLVHLV